MWAEIYRTESYRDRGTAPKNRCSRLRLTRHHSKAQIHTFPIATYKSRGETSLKDWISGVEKERSQKGPIDSVIDFLS
ncbi:hypothetical protein Y1Q_0022837 [Alligator mississippiensis]|uniref:Uncharacterized protein n=1 Tax=Alligator mississippiensis TaxID=8496 RepID=A0A151N4P2_ALLMI|nr:hypothetical protein Y1Q_0022837 [Alligator mississippiensis]